MTPDKVRGYYNKTYDIHGNEYAEKADFWNGKFTLDKDGNEKKRLATGTDMAAGATAALGITAGLVEANEERTTAAGEAVKFASMGASLGSVGGLVGMAIGAGAGAITGSIYGAIENKREQERIDRQDRLDDYKDYELGKSKIKEARNRAYKMYT